MIPFLRSVRHAALVSFLAAGLPATAFAEPIGAVGDETIMTTIQRLQSIREGTQGPHLYILIASTCDKSVSMKHVVETAGGNVQVSWVPAPVDGNGTDPATARLVGADLEGLNLAMKGDLSRLPPAGDAARKQAQEITSNLWRAMYRATSRPLATPTIVYRDYDGLVRVVRGSVGEDLFTRIAADAR